MNYLDEYIREQTERQQLSGFITEASRKKKIYKDINEVPHNIWDDIVMLLKHNKKDEADIMIRDIYGKIRDLPDFQAKHFAWTLLKNASE